VVDLGFFDIAQIECVPGISKRAFGTDKGGFFRNFSRKNSNGDYRLRAHVTTGQIELLGNAEKKGQAAKPD